MRTIRRIGAGVLLLLLATAARGQEPTRLVELIRQIGSPRYSERDRASTDLEKLGPAVLPALRAACQQADLETARRAGDLVRRIEEKRQIDELLAPTIVHLKLQSATVEAAVVELARQSRYPLKLEGDADVLAKRRVTLDTGAIPFWEALDRLRDAAKLTEKPALRASNPPPPPPGSVRTTVKRTIAAASPTITLVPGFTTQRHVSRAGAVLFRARYVPVVAAKNGEIRLMLDLAVEPRLQPNDPVLVGAPSIERAVDDRGQELAVVLETESALASLVHDGNFRGRGFRTTSLTSQPEQQRQVLVRLRAGGQPSARLVELRGTALVRFTLINEVIASLDDITHAAGKSTAGKNGGTLQVQTIDKLPNGGYSVRMSLDNLGSQAALNNNFGGIGGRVIINGGNVVLNGSRLHRPSLPDLVDAHGQKYRLQTLAAQEVRIVNNRVSRTVTAHYLPTDGVGAPSRLVLYGTRPLTIPVPFHFHEVTLP